MSDRLIPEAEITPKSRFPLIWFIPLIAAIIGGWLAYKYYSERGTFVVINFEQASGIEARKTPVKYKDVEVGMVRKVGLSPDLKTVRVTVEIYNDMEQNLGPDTQFWIVSPRVTLRGVSGLQTLLSGVNIAMEPGEAGASKTEYAGLSQPPTISIQSDGQSLVLSTEKLGSLDIGSPVYFRQLEVGQVTGYRLNPDSQKVDVDIFIYAPYHKKIRTNTRFWNASGFELDLSTQGVSARIESLTSLLIGGISFETNEDEVGYPLTGKSAFKLYDNQKQAREDTSGENKLNYVLYFNDTLHGLYEGAAVKYLGVKLGQVEKILLSNDPLTSSIRTKVHIALHVDKLSDDSNRMNAEKFLQSLVEQGLRAQLRSDSLITGAQFIGLTVVPQNADNAQTLAKLNDDYDSIFPSIKAQGSILSFDPSGVTSELNAALRSANQLLASNDVKKTLKYLASTSRSIDTITRELAEQGISGEVTQLLAEASKTAASLQLALGDARTVMGTVNGATQTLQKNASKALIDARVMMQSAGKAATAISGTAGTLQRDVSTALIDVRKLSQQLTKSTGVLEKDVSRAIIDARVMLQSTGKAATSVSGTAGRLQQDISTALIDVRKLSQQLNKSTGVLEKDISKAIIDARVMMQNVGKSIVTLQKDTSVTLGGINKATNTVERSVNATLSEDSALQYRFQQLINDLSEAANSFTVLADTLQRKPNSLILGK
ncbi:intermembrane transport protein PqiB [Leucothrix pacifica]|uniref:Mce/MlaD domain-containing protein n=1 Tax=Leucothrix pacifica TaxID=1247513 RepID=A0A317C0H1_9GAMM|nr:MlaD family protein [Leucothrix pacifica]PWQ92145.1 hypothetical protein DKW60_22645 [Leucothrix pacifica]